MGNLFSFIFLTFPSFSFIFFKTEKAVQGGAFGGMGQVTNGAPWGWCTISSSTSNGAPPQPCAISSFSKKIETKLVTKLLMAHRVSGAPLLVHRGSGAPLLVELVNY